MWTIDWIRWVLGGSEKGIYLGVKHKDKLWAFVAGTILKTIINKEHIKQAEISMMTVHTKLRNKRIVPVLIKEMQRRFNLEGIWQGIFKNKYMKPGTLCTDRIFSRPLRMKRLNDLELFKVRPDNAFFKKM